MAGSRSRASNLPLASGASVKAETVLAPTSESTTIPQNKTGAFLASTVGIAQSRLEYDDASIPSGFAAFASSYPPGSERARFKCLGVPQKLQLLYASEATSTPCRRSIPEYPALMSLGNSARNLTEDKIKIQGPSCREMSCLVCLMCPHILIEAQDQWVERCRYTVTADWLSLNPQTDTVMYKIGQLYMISKHSHEQSDRGEGVEVVQNEPFEDPHHGNGQFTEKRVYLNSKLPSWARAVVPKIFYVTEKAWNYYPYTITGGWKII
ncbi:hypothetical protein A6R68_06360 [Neotoma lepida]|uniref:Phosphatidylinositol transfer protein N-terminal domain-containing protein n=1 Tax=Neotoma lepida TaxID=56216 RepID=A0A1A6GGX3_NEOLE|nr:hypothetical protein A6R68_06360 [Neotoma lepida]